MYPGPVARSLLLRDSLRPFGLMRRGMPIPFQVCHAE